MPIKRIDFYVLNTDNIDTKLNFICRLIEKIYLQNHAVFVFCETEALAETIDEWLWVFDPESFVPHHLLGEGPTPPPPVQIGWSEPVFPKKEILLNLSQQIPSFCQQFQRVIEVIHEDDELKQLARERYQNYKKQGHVVYHHAIDCHKIGAVSENV